MYGELFSCTQLVCVAKSLLRMSAGYEFRMMNVTTGKIAMIFGPTSVYVSMQCTHCTWWYLEAIRGLPYLDTDTWTSPFMWLKKSLHNFGDYHDPWKKKTQKLPWRNLCLFNINLKPMFEIFFLWILQNILNANIGGRYAGNIDTALMDGCQSYMYSPWPDKLLAAVEPYFCKQRAEGCVLG